MGLSYSIFNKIKRLDDSGDPPLIPNLFPSRSPLSNETVPQCHCERETAVAISQGIETKEIATLPR